MFIGSGIHYYRRVAKDRSDELIGKIGGVMASFMVVVFVVQGFDPHLTLRGTADLMYPMLGATGFLLRDLDFPKGTSLDTARPAKALLEQPG